MWLIIACTRACGLQKEVSAAEAVLATEEKAISAFTKAEGAQKATEATVSPGCPSCCCQYFVCFFKLFCDEDEVGSSSTCININTSIRTLEALGWSLAPNVCLCLLAWCSHLVGQRRGSKGRRVISHGPRLLPRHGACRRRHGRGVLNANPLWEDGKEQHFCYPSEQKRRAHYASQYCHAYTPLCITR